MRSTIWVVLVAAACGAKTVNPTAPPLHEWICTGRTTDREVSTKVQASSREDAVTRAKQQYPEMLTPFCQTSARP